MLPRHSAPHREPGLGDPAAHLFSRAIRNPAILHLPCGALRTDPMEVVILAAQPGRVGRSAAVRSMMPLWPISHTAPRQAGWRPAFSAIGRNLVEHRVGEIALRARADRPAPSFEDLSVAELMQAMERALGLDAPAMVVASIRTAYREGRIAATIILRECSAR